MEQQRISINLQRVFINLQRLIWIIGIHFEGDRRFDAQSKLLYHYDVPIPMCNQSILKYATQSTSTSTWPTRYHRLGGIQ